MKRCKKCGEQKPLASFYEHPYNRDGLNGACKVCCRAYGEERRRRISGTTEYRQQRMEVSRRRRERRPEIVTARTVVMVNMRNGNLQREPCVICGGTDTEAHHPDYNQPLKVMWLCKAHHIAMHNYIFLGP